MTIVKLFLATLLNAIGINSPMKRIRVDKSKTIQRENQDTILCHLQGIPLSLESKCILEMEC